MAVNLNKLGLDITVASPPPTFPTGSFERTWRLSACRTIDGIDNLYLWTWQPISRDPGFISRMLYYLIFPFNVALWALIHRKKYDAILTSSPPIFTGIPGLLSKLLFKKPWILDIRDRWIDASISLGFLKKGSLFERSSRYFERLCYQRANLIAVTTRELGKNISSDSTIQDKIIVVPNGVDTDYFRPIVIPKKNQIIYTGNIGYAQDLEKVIHAVKQVIKRHDLKLLLVGDGDIRWHLEQIVQAEALEDVVQFTGVVPRDFIPHMLSESILGLAPLKKLDTLEYAVPTKAYEYMSCGLPFLGCGKGEIADLARKSGAGIIADNTPDSIATTILELIENPIKAEEMGKRGRDFVKGNYDRRSIAKRLKQHIEMVL